jgi:hypothetical protein
MSPMMFMCWPCDLSASDASRMPGLKAASAIVSQFYVIQWAGVSHVLAM